MDSTKVWIERARPAHVAIIMDGNGRWARSRGLPRSAGHSRGAEALRRAVRAAIELGLDYLTVFAFSAENWRRPAREVDGLRQRRAARLATGYTSPARRCRRGQPR
jgi:undecaprenyl diphosphate synthase